MSLHNETMNLVSQLGENLEKLVKQMNDGLNKLPEKDRSKIAVHQSNINHIVNLAKRGDYSELQKMMNKNADSNNI